MSIYTMREAKTNLSKIGKALKNGEEEYVIITKNGKPYLKVTLCEGRNDAIIGKLKGKHTFEDEPDWFNDDISKSFNN